MKSQSFLSSPPSIDPHNNQDLVNGVNYWSSSSVLAASKRKYVTMHVLIAVAWSLQQCNFNICCSIFIYTKGKNWPLVGGISWSIECPPFVFSFGWFLCLWLTTTMTCRETSPNGKEGPQLFNIVFIMNRVTFFSFLFFL